MLTMLKQAEVDLQRKVQNGVDGVFDKRRLPGGHWMKPRPTPKIMMKNSIKKIGLAQMFRKR